MTKERKPPENKNNQYEEEFEDFKKLLSESIDLDFLEDIPENNGKNSSIPFPYGSSISRPYNFH